VAARRHLFIGSSVDVRGLSRLTNLDSPPEGRLCRPDNLNAHAAAPGGGRGEGLSSPR
jgi:hypothetical protein